MRRKTTGESEIIALWLRQKAAAELSDGAVISRFRMVFRSPERRHFQKRRQLYVWGIRMKNSSLQSSYDSSSRTILAGTTEDNSGKGKAALMGRGHKGEI